MAARSDARVLLIGESGTGKELLAAHIHQYEPVRGGSVREGELRGHPHRIAGNANCSATRRASFTGATAAAPRQVRAGRRRHDLPGRGGRSARRVAGQAAARAAGGRIPSRRRRADHPRQRARDVGDQSRSGRDGGAGEIPRGSVLPAERGADPRARAARAAARCPAAGRIFPGRILRAQ